MKLNEFQKLAASSANCDALSHNSSREQKLEIAAVGLRDSALQMMESVKRHLEGEELDETVLFNQICDALHFTAAATDALGTSLEAIGHISLGRSRRVSTPSDNIM